MNKEEAAQIAARILEKYRQRTYADLGVQIPKIEYQERTGSSGVKYSVEVSVDWDDKEGGDLRVMAIIYNGWWSSIFPMSDSFVISPNGRFVGEE